MGFFDRLSEGLSRSRTKFTEQMNVLLQHGPKLDDDFWDDLEETLILADIGGAAACSLVGNIRDRATRMALPDAQAVLALLEEHEGIEAQRFYEALPFVLAVYGAMG